MNTLVIGGGLIGLTSAYVLQSQGESVTLLEANNGLGLEASYANGGLLTASMSDPWNSPGVYRQLTASLLDANAAIKLRLSALPSLLSWGTQFIRHSSRHRHNAAMAANYRLSTYSLAKTSALREKLALVYQSESVGSIKLFRDRASMAASLSMAENLRDLGLKFVPLTSDALIEREPALAPIQQTIAGGLYFPDDETGDAFLFCQSLARAFTAAGGTIQTNTAVQRLVVEQQKVIGIETSEGIVAAKRVVVAAGNRSSDLLKPTGLRLPIKPVKGYSLTLELDDSALSPRIPVIDDGLHAAATPLGSQLRLAGTAEFAEFDQRLDRSRINHLLGLLQALYPDIYRRTDPKAALPWAGLRPVSADGKPFIGLSSVEGLYVNTGHGHLGWTMAMGSAHLLASLIQRQSPEVDYLPFQTLR